MFVRDRGCNIRMVVFVIILSLYPSLTVQTQHSARLKNVGGLSSPDTFAVSTYIHRDVDNVGVHAEKVHRAEDGELVDLSPMQTEISKSPVSMVGFRRKRNTDDDLPVCPENVQTSEVCSLTDSWSCENRCGQTPADTSYCSCSSSCLVLTNCCEDFEATCPSTFAEATEELNRFENVTATCDYRMNKLLISTCPKSAFQTSRRGCELTENVTDAFYLVPVYDESMGKHFKNIMCYRCWADPDSSEDSVHFWAATHIFNHMGKYGDEYSTKPLLDIIAKSPELAQWKEPDLLNVPAAAKCNSSAVQVCSGCQSRYITDKCRQFHSEITFDGISYKNRYCYFCSSEFLQILQSASGTSRLRYCRNPEDIHRPVNLDEFSVSVSFNPRGQFVLAQSGAFFAWNKMQCSDKDSCNTLECGKDTLPDGDICSHKFAHFAMLEVCRPQDNGETECTPRHAGRPEFSVHALTAIVKPLLEQKIQSHFSSARHHIDFKHVTVDDNGGVVQITTRFDVSFIEEEGYPQLGDILKLVGTENLSTLRQGGSWLFCVHLKFNVPLGTSVGIGIEYAFHRCYLHDFQKQEQEEASCFPYAMADWTLIVIFLISMGLL